MTLFHGILTAPSGPTCPYVAGGWALARDRHPSTTSLWRTGATAVKPCSRFSVFLGGPRYDRRWPLWGTVIRRAAPLVPHDAVMRVLCDDAPKQKAGRQIDGRDRYRQGAGSARQEDRTLRGWHCV
jgi:hypothetical protein